jgi:hypothetical protein
MEQWLLEGVHWWGRLKILLAVWLLALLAMALLFHTLGRRRDSMLWLLWPVLLATFVVTPLVYLIARLDRPETLF